ncbi:MAG: mannose-1-phosphate guanylyltransferase [Planctomycetota bacterium]|nr:mannose-1-phosphate guanylyltransferase [Planctomycetota bacterium]MDA1212280.1 mannose-1-phosphate guanylyltransferase [Planctomycetota bacterium]
MLHAVVMAGGSGTRFWPASRRAFPKQFLKLSGNRTLLQGTLDRVAPIIPGGRQWVVTNPSLAAETARQLPALSSGQIILEPCARNTAPAIGLAAIHLLARDPDAVMLVLPADHVISPDEVFVQSVNDAASIVADDPQQLVLFGVVPDFPATGFGYIERGEILIDGSPAYRVAAFREKPDEVTAKTYLACGRYYWNCGIFVWRADRILASLAQCEPDISEKLKTVARSIDETDYDDVLLREFPAMKSISIDYAVLEKGGSVAVVPAPYTWNDVGSWGAMSELQAADEQGNVVRGAHVGVNTSGCIISCNDDDHLIATLGMSDCIVVHTADATLVANRNDEQAIRQLVALMEERGYERFL